MIPKAISMGLRQITLLLLFFIFYVFIGGIVFMFLEAPFELQTKHSLKDTYTKFKENLQSLETTEELKTNISELVNNYLQQQEYLLSVKLVYEEEKLKTRWDFLNSFFFAITVVTTIGYGHLSPSTSFGRVFCIIFAIFGIPMTGILLGAIGDRFSRCFLDKVHKVRKRTDKQRVNKLIVLKHALFYLMPWFVVFLILPSIIFTFSEDWSILEGFYYSFITLSTIGFGDYVAAQSDDSWVRFYKILVVLWIIFGLAYLSMILNFISQGFRSHHLSNVVHSLKRMSAPPLHGRFKNSRNQRNKRGLKRQQSFPLPYPNGNVLSVSGTSTPETLTPTTPTPSPNIMSSENSSFHFDSEKYDKDCSNECSSKFSFFKFLRNFNKKKKQRKAEKAKGSTFKKSTSLPEMQRFINTDNNNRGEIARLRPVNPMITIIVDRNSDILSQTSSTSLSPSFLQNSPSYSLRSSNHTIADPQIFFHSLDDHLQVSYV